jgi:hypothetical protein
MVEAVLTPAHSHTLEPLLNQPFAGAFDVSTIMVVYESREILGVTSKLR